MVPPNPAMVDEDAAAEVRAELTGATHARSADLERLTTGLDRDRDLLARVRAWRDRRPTVGELADAADAAAVRSTETAARAEAADARVAELDARAESLEADRPRLAAAAVTTRERAAELAGLAAETGRAPALRDRARSAAADAARAEAHAAAAQAEGAQAREAADAARRREDRHTGVAERARAELADLPLDSGGLDGPSEPSTIPGTAIAAVPAAELAEVGDEAAGIAEVQKVGLSVLRGAYAQACATYAAAEVGADLSAQLGMAERDARGAQGRVDGLDATARTAAEALLRSPDAADPAARRAAADQARVELARADARRQEAATATALGRRELAGFTAAPRSVAPYGVPTDPADGQERIDRAEQDRRAAEDAATGTARLARDAVRERDAVAASAEGFGHVVRGLDGSATDPAAEERVPFAGDVAAAVEATAATRAALTAAAGERARADREVRSAVDAVAQFAQEPGSARSPAPCASTSAAWRAPTCPRWRATGRRPCVPGCVRWRTTSRASAVTTPGS